MAATLHPRLRAWHDEDFPIFRAMHREVDVGYWLGGVLDEEQALAAFTRIRSQMDRHGWGMWAVLDEDGIPVGAAGLQPARDNLPFAPAIEAAWRLRRSAWGRGYITDVMRPILTDGFDRGGLDEIVAFTSAPNLRSQGVMARLGFERDPAGDFDHPALAAGHPLRRHIFYRMGRPIA